ncbi:MAG TPA: hypothetical protein DCL41_07825 [Bdellovibrionales bacterium]|nr:hypothetical protein [Pseudobdellovibrionaceae bacterium]HAG91764.1 hypothetical protein [Bdellovibrionales bacterium]|tara:strand:+ start:1585 stop:2562 length:978 start_codon:yes stop_codon:yes gene_type:complete
MDTAEVYMPIAIDELVSGTLNPVDLFIRLSEGKFIQVAKANTTLDLSQIKNYKTKSIEYLYVRKDDFSRISAQSIQLAGMMIQRNDVAPEKKATYLTKASSSVFKRMDHIGLDLEMYHNAQQVTEAVITLVETQSQFAVLFGNLASSNDHLLNHSVGVSVLSAMIGVELGFQKKATLEKLALGGLLHDIGLKTLPSGLIKKSLIEMTNDEAQLYETHPYRGAKVLLGLGSVPDDVIAIVYEHHENAIGQGYPQRIRDVKMHPLAKIVALADQFISLTLIGPNCPNPKSAREALLFIESTLGLPFNKDAFRALKRVIEKEPQRKAG